ncbi:hypothetical protein QBC35DRAFT_376802 [Podospora australis]|uniref:Uncharacterized protein n=1 Tax=Podospora australis TaxID=1536484 RepID=A0AAN7ALW5_9PEZI|nr:hypothetical protein QBC35DRAFT_376802 [Podospora australis]
MQPMMSSSRDPTARLRAGLNPLLTASLGVYHPQHNNGTPLSALSVASHGAFSSEQTPLSAIQPYNPQEWISSPMAGPAPGRMPPGQPPQQSYGEPQGSPLPPPPYSPPRSGRPTSMTFDQGGPTANISVARAPPPPVQRAATESPVANPSFPPPPGTRGASRERRFGLPSLGRRREPEQTSTPIEQHQQSRPSPLGIFTRGGSGQQPGPLTLQIPPNQAPQRTDSDASQNMAPAARRAVSTPAVATPTSARSRSSSQIRWDPGMPVPPPPPGPPPSSSRSQSMQRLPSGSDPIVSPPTRRPPPSGVMALGPVPLTPANWRDGDNLPGPPPRTDSPNAAAVQAAETASTGSSGTGVQPESTISAVSSASSAGGLRRSPVVRSDKSLLERRSESRTRATRLSVDAQGSQGLSDIVIPAPSSGGLQRRLTINRGTPRTGRTNDTPKTGEYLDTPESRTPRANGMDQETPTRLSPRSQKQPETRHHDVPRALPTPPTGSRSSSTHRGMGPDVPLSAPLSPALPLSKHMVITQSSEQFARGTIDRFAAFANREASASSDAERVRLFAEFFVTESRIRRERYGAAIGAMGSEVLDLTRDLFRPMPVRRESINSATSGTVELTPQSSEPRSHRGSIGSAFGNNNGGGSSAATPTSVNQQGAPSPGPSSAGQNWPSNNYMPSLSPILSMSVSDALDEQDSRGRPASRWWEADSTGAPSSRIERSKRESKYMGVPKEAREALQWIDDPQPSPASSSKRASNGYPLEKTGWHDELATPQNMSRNSIASSSTAPNTPNPDHLDVSRLVTLPPPYPRHHPAVNNNHPELTEIRNSIRVVSDMSEIDTIKEIFKQGSLKQRADAAEAAKERRQALRRNLQEDISSGAIGYADAAAIEADATADEHNKLKELEKKDFDDFQAAVVMPVNEILQNRINKATELFDGLRSRLFDDTHQSNPNLPQEEGDEQPELLEKLTLLKWIFEARETLHRAMYDLLSDRNDRYRDMVLVPYKLAGQEGKVNSAKAFFQEDGAKRALTFCEEVLHRTQEFRDVVEETVVRGVEVQLNAFWDIAPPLKRLLDKIPGDMEGFHIQIPTSEYVENPSYHDHPLQYLFSLLLHAEKSTYQFIESQTNLLCLLHEVKEACASAKAKVMESDGRNAGRVEEVKAEETTRLTDDLKEKVRLVQDQWNSALGETVGVVKERVGGWLLETGGWDESFEEGGVGGV